MRRAHRLTLQNQRIIPIHSCCSCGGTCGRRFFAYRDVGTSREAGSRERCPAGTAALALPCASRHSDILSIVGTSREAGSRERCPAGTAALAPPCASRHSDILSIVGTSRESGSRERCPAWAATLAPPCASRHSYILSIVGSSREAGSRERCPAATGYTQYSTPPFRAFFSFATTAASCALL